MKISITKNKFFNKRLFLMHMFRKNTIHYIKLSI